MNIMKINSKFTTNILSKVVSKILSKKIESVIKIDIKEIAISEIDDDFNIHVDASARMSKNEFAKITNGIIEGGHIR